MESACLLRLVGGDVCIPIGKAYTVKNKIVPPSDTGGIVQVTLRTTGLTSSTLTSNGGSGAMISRH